MTEIDSIDHPLMLLTRDLLKAEGREHHQRIIIDDVDNIEQAMAAGIKIEHLFFYNDHVEKYPVFFNRVKNLAELHTLRPRTSKKVFGGEKMARIYAIAQTPSLPTLNQMSGDIIVLDGLTITGNIGAIIRSAVAFNMSGMCILNFSDGELYDRRLIRSSKGHVFKLPIVGMRVEPFFDYCSRNQIMTVNCSQCAEQSLQQVLSTPERMAIIVGAEKQGISTQVEQLAEKSITIPMEPGVESLNVSVAAAITLYTRYQLRQ